MQVLFTNPPFWGPRRGSTYMAGVRAGSRWPFLQASHSFPGRACLKEYVPVPFFLGFACTWAKAHGVEAVYRDSIALRESYGQFFTHVQNGRYDYIVFESATPSWDHDARIIGEIKKLAPESKIIVTGTIGSTRAQEILEDHPVHAVCKGEYEKGVMRIVKGQSGVIDFDFLTEKEMNSQPPPYMDQQYAPLYFDHNPKGQRWPLLHAWGSRGCLWRCLFCSWPATMTNNDPHGDGKRAYRIYSGDWLLSYMPQWKKDYGFEGLYFDDDTFNVGDKHVLDICRAMYRVGLPWTAMCRIDTLKPETWREMKRSGCIGVKIGYESGSQRVIDDIIHKQLNLEKARETTHLLKSIGLTVHGTFSVGHPGETPEEVQRTTTYRQSLNLDTYQESGMALLEGTPADSLVQLGSLPKYPGAKVDDNFIRDTDGLHKLAQMVG